MPVHRMVAPGYNCTVEGAKQKTLIIQERAHLDTTTRVRDQTRWNAGFIRQGFGPRSLLPDKSGVPVVVSRCTLQENNRTFVRSDRAWGVHLLKARGFTPVEGNDFGTIFIRPGGHNETKRNDNGCRR